MLFYKMTQIENKSKFWDHKPTMERGEFVSVSGQIAKLNDKSVYCSETPTKIPDAFSWKIIDQTNSREIQDVCDFLNKHYSSRTAKPDAKQDLDTPKVHFTPNSIVFHLGENGILLSIVSNKTASIIGTIGCRIQNVVIFDKVEKFAQGCCLCTHTAYRNKNLACVLINEMSRLVFTKNGISQGFFESLKRVVRPVCTIRNYIRPLNYLKLHRTNFLMYDEKNTETVHKNLLVEDLPDSNYVPMRTKDLEIVYNLYTRYASKFSIYSKYTKNEFESVLSSNIVKCYVILKDDVVVDFVSYRQFTYETGGENIDGAYMFLHSLTTISGESMIDNLLRILSKNNIDVFFAADSGEMSQILLSKNSGDESFESDIETYSKVYEHKFLKYKKKYLNLFNWRCPYLSSSRVFLFGTPF